MTKYYRRWKLMTFDLYRLCTSRIPESISAVRCCTFQRFILNFPPSSEASYSSVIFVKLFQTYRSSVNFLDNVGDIQVWCTNIFSIVDSKVIFVNSSSVVVVAQQTSNRRCVFTKELVSTNRKRVVMSPQFEWAAFVSNPTPIVFVILFTAYFEVWPSIQSNASCLLELCA